MVSKQNEKHKVISKTEKVNLQNAKFPKFTKKLWGEVGNFIAAQINHVHAIETSKHVDGQITANLVAFQYPVCVS